MRVKILKRTALLLISWFLVHTLWITLDGLRDDDQATDAALILGNTVYPDGSLSKRLQSRVDKGLDLYQHGRVKKLVVSGGLGKEGQYEAEAMKKYLIQAGVPASAIIVDNYGDNTWLSAQHYRQIQARCHFQSVTVVSQFYHLSRTKLILRKLGLTQVYAVHANYFELRDFYSLVREFFAFYQYWLLYSSSFK